MKKVISIVALFLIVLSSSAIDDICRTRHNGVFNVFFKNVVWNSGLINITGAQCLQCYSPGLKRCIPENAGSGSYPAGYDAVDIAKSKEMFDYVDQQVEAKNFEGTYQIIVQVTGESFKRVYKCSWGLGEMGEGEDRFSRTDLPN
jgi:hypothetical protein